ncbi:hypothetical protein J4408_03175 [Candidatus Pacearchaeota archaeon]|nr:hypothetical protein [Candidatus Pacearchaeota archaeon]
MEEEKRLKLAIIAGAAQALKFKAKNRKATDQEIIQHISDNVSKMLEEVDKEL